MNEDMQQQFVSWLAQKLQAKDEQDLKSKMQEMGQDGIKQAYDAFMQEQQQGAQGQGMPIQAEGGKLEYLRCLQAYKKGGAMAMKDCGCGTSKMKSGGRMDKNENAPSKDYMKGRTEGKPQGISKKADKRGDHEKADKNPGKKDYMSLGKKKDDKTARTNVPEGKSKWQSGVGGINKHQLGGMATYNQGTPKPSNILVTKDNGSTGEWGNAIPQVPAKNYMLNNSSVGINQINDEHLNHLRKLVPTFDQVVGQPMIANGQVPRYSPQQSDMIRSMLGKYPMEQALQPRKGIVPGMQMAGL